MKNIWTEDDFEQMGWHDCHIYSLKYDPDSFQLILDIDYIFEWLRKDEKTFNFSVAPATLIFTNIWDLKIEVEPNGSFEINEITKENPKLPKNAEFVNKSLEWDWVIDVFNGVISFKSIGFLQTIRKQPVIQESQTLPISERKYLNEYLLMLNSSESTTLIF